MAEGNRWPRRNGLCQSAAGVVVELERVCFRQVGAYSSFPFPRLDGTTENNTDIWALVNGGIVTMRNTDHRIPQYTAMTMWLA